MRTLFKAFVGLASMLGMIVILHLIIVRTFIIFIYLLIRGGK